MSEGPEAKIYEQEANQHLYPQLIELAQRYIHADETQKPAVLAELQRRVAAYNAAMSQTITPRALSADFLIAHAQEEEQSPQK